MVNPSYSISAVAFLKEPNIGGNSLMLSRATCQVYFIFFVSSNDKSSSPGLLLLTILSCSGIYKIGRGEINFRCTRRKNSLLAMLIAKRVEYLEGEENRSLDVEPTF